jgi:hypothetical protein
METKQEVRIEDAHLLANNHFLRLGEFFDIKERSERLENQKALEEVLDWAKKKTGSEDIIDVLLHIRSVERQFSTDDEPRLTKVRRYIAIENDKEHLEKELSLLKGTDVPGIRPQ